METDNLLVATSIRYLCCHILELLQRKKKYFPNQTKLMQRMTSKPVLDLVCKCVPSLHSACPVHSAWLTCPLLLIKTLQINSVNSDLLCPALVSEYCSCFGVMTFVNSHIWTQCFIKINKLLLCFWRLCANTVITFISIILSVLLLLIVDFPSVEQLLLSCAVYQFEIRNPLKFICKRKKNQQIYKYW